MFAQTPPRFAPARSHPKVAKPASSRGVTKGHLNSRGETLVLVDASGASNNKVTYPAQPRVSGFPVNPLADGNGNGEPDLVDYALGNDLGSASMTPKLALVQNALSSGPTVELSCPQSLTATNVALRVFFSRDLVHWQDASPELEVQARQPLDERRQVAHLASIPPFQREPRVFFRFGVIMP